MGVGGSSEKLITAQNFKDEIAEGVTVVKIGAEWCSPCKRYGDEVGVIIDELGDSVSFCKVDIDDPLNSGNSESIAMKRATNLDQGIPHIAIFKDGDLIEAIKGKPEISDLRKKILALL